MSRYTDPHYHRVVGKSSPPRDVDTFLVDQQGDGGRIFSWNYPDPPPDLAGFRIRYRQQTVQSSIIRYEYRLRRTDTQTWSAWIPIPGSAPGNEHDSSFTVQPLVEQQEYAFQLRSRTLTGPSEPTATFTATTLFGEVIVELPVADAPTVTIQAVASGIEATTVTLMATVGDGGTYDGSVEYAWRVSGGTLNEATAAAPVWTRPAVTGDSPYTIDLTITVRGTGTVADDGTSDTAVAPQVTTVVSVTGTLPTAAAPAVAIDPVSSGNEGTSVTLGATVTGGTYDALTYAWTVSSGTLDDATAAAPTWRRPLVNADSNVSISLTVSATGTGTVARANTSDTAMATDVTTLVSNVAAQGSVGDRITSEEWTLPSDNGVGSGIAVDGTYAYVVDLVDEKVYVYQLSDGVRQTSRNLIWRQRIQAQRGLRLIAPMRMWWIMATVRCMSTNSRMAHNKPHGNLISPTSIPMPEGFGLIVRMPMWWTAREPFMSINSRMGRSNRRAISRCCSKIVNRKALGWMAPMRMSSTRTRKRSLSINSLTARDKRRMNGP